VTLDAIASIRVRDHPKIGGFISCELDDCLPLGTSNYVQLIFGIVGHRNEIFVLPVEEAHPVTKVREAAEVAPFKLTDPSRKCLPMP
jgi:hypothetical protein